MDTQCQKRFDGKTVLISGSTGGFGSSAAQLFAGQGANLILTDLSQQGLDEQAEALKTTGTKVEIVAGDISVEQTSQLAVELAISSFGKLDVAINNAGIAHTQGKLPTLEADEAKKVMDVNVLGVFYAMKHQIPVMLANAKQSDDDVSIINVASVAGLVGAPTMSIYVAAKHAVVGMTKSTALEYARTGLRINALCPAFARTPIVTDALLGNAPDAKQAEEFLVRGVPMRRLAEPQEITQAMLWMADPSNTFMTGQAIAIDGGITAS